MKLAGYQPQYFPRLHYLARILDADIFTISDYVQFVRAHNYPAIDGIPKKGKSYQADTPIKSSRGVQYLTVPIRHTGKFLPINQTALAYNRPWPHEHLTTIRLNYARATNYAAVFSDLTKLLGQQYDTLAQLNTLTILWALAWILTNGPTPIARLNLPYLNKLLARPHPFRLRKIVLKSETDIAPPDATRDATDWIIETCKIFGANEYYVGGTATAAYIDAARFNQAGIRLLQQNWVCQPYTQLFPKRGFIPNLSILDLLVNEGQARIWQILQA